MPNKQEKEIQVLQDALKVMTDDLDLSTVDGKARLTLRAENLLLVAILKTNDNDPFWATRMFDSIVIPQIRQRLAMAVVNPDLVTNLDEVVIK